MEIRGGLRNDEERMASRVADRDKGLATLSDGLRSWESGLRLFSPLRDNKLVHYLPPREPHTRHTITTIKHQHQPQPPPHPHPRPIFNAIL